MFDIVWTVRFVVKNKITVKIVRLSKLLGVNKTKPIIKTVTGKGYKSITPVYPEDQANEGLKNDKGNSLLSNQIMLEKNAQSCFDKAFIGIVKDNLVNRQIYEPVKQIV